MDWDGEKLYFANGVSEEFKKQFAATVKYMNERGASGDIAKLHASDNIYHIAESAKKGISRFVVDNKTIY